MSSSWMLRLCLAALLFATLSSSVSGQACSLVVPYDPLNATGLATPYIVSGCIQNSLGNGGAATFVQATIVDMDTGALYTYTPLVLSATAPNNVAQIAPVIPKLPKNYTAALWFGTNGGSTTLIATTKTDANSGTVLNSLSMGNCVNGGGTPYTIFGQFAACNAHQFFDAVYALVNKGLITVGPSAGFKANQVPAIGLDLLGDPCPTTHSWSIVDQDQSDNTDALYLIMTNTGNLAVSTATNKNTLNAAKIAFTEFDNGSDEKLVLLVQQALGCTPYQVQDLGDNGGQTFSSSLATNEIQATLSMQVEPRAFIPAKDPMVMNAITNQPDLGKLNAYRTAVGHSALTTVNDASTTIYCNNMYAVGAPAIAKWLNLLVTKAIPAPDFGVGISNTLAGVLVGRYGAAVNNVADGGVLGCPTLLPMKPNGQPRVNPFVNFQPSTTAGLTCPPPLGPTTCDLPAGSTSTLAQVLGVQDLQADMTGQFNVDVPAGLTINTVGVIGGTAGPTSSSTTTTNNNNAFNATSFAAGVGVMAGVVLIVGVIFYFTVWRKNQQKSLVATTNMSMNRF